MSFSGAETGRFRSITVTYNRSSRNRRSAVEEPLILDRYRPLADLGSGGHGSVVLAFDTKMTRRVAIKRLPLPLDRTGRPVARVGLAEARTAALLNHPNIVIVHEWDTDTDEAFIVMEHLDGASLADLLDETRSAFTADETAAIIASVGAAVAFAHANGVLHLDLKPANVLITREGVAKVADFGVSALTDATGRAAGTAGTIGYMPPEQIRGQKLDERTDCWALAALTYELLTNANPFDADTAEGSLFKIEIADQPAPSEFERGIPAAIDAILLAALAPEPDERYTTVTEFTRALLPYLGDPEVGRDSLRELVSGIAEDDEATYPPLGLWDRLSRYAGIARRTVSALGCAWLTWAGIGAFGLAVGPLVGCAALVAVAAALAPGLGTAIGLGAFALGVGWLHGWVAGLAVAVTAGAFWAVRARHGEGDAIAPVYGPALGILRAAPAAPLLLGFVFEPLPAALSAGAAALATMTASAATGSAAPLLSVGWRFAVAPRQATGSDLSQLALPGVAWVVVCWMLAAAVCSFGCRRATRTGAFVGVLAGTAVLVAAYAGWGWLAGSTVIGVDAYALDITAGAALALLVVALGAPARPEWE
jgi:serine/threonine-protein kinase